jgi:hypothetical protein
MILPSFRGSVVLRTLERSRAGRIKCVVGYLQPAGRYYAFFARSALWSGHVRPSVRCLSACFSWRTAGWVLYQGQLSSCRTVGCPEISSKKITKEESCEVGPTNSNNGRIYTMLTTVTRLKSVTVCTVVSVVSQPHSVG